MAGNNFMQVFSTLGKLNGSSDFAAWLTRFNRCCLLTNKNEDATKGQIIMLCLSGQALAVAEQLVLERDGAQTFAQVQARLETVFDTVARREQKVCEPGCSRSRVSKSSKAKIYPRYFSRTTTSIVCILQ